jgi:phosphate transport system permease protein
MPNADTVNAVRTLLPSGEQRARLRRWRRLKDQISKYFITFAGISVVLAFTTIFVYLFSEVAPLFSSASISAQQQYKAPHAAPLLTSIERYGDVGLSVDSSGELRFFNAQTGETRQNIRLALPDNPQITAMAYAAPRAGMFAVATAQGQVLVAKHSYHLSYPNDQRQVSPVLTYPLGEMLLQLDPQGKAIETLAVQESAAGTALVAFTSDGRLLLSRFEAQTEFLTGETNVVRHDHQLSNAPSSASKILLDNSLKHLYVADHEGRIHYYDISNPTQARYVEALQAVTKGQQITALEFLVGSVSLIVGGSDGSLSQWFLVRDTHNNFHLKRVRDFQQHPGAIVQIVPEYARKGFVVLDAANHIGIHYGTSARTLMLDALPVEGAQRLALSPINTEFLLQSHDATITRFQLENAHPDISWRALWNEVWYEGRTDAEYVWQASSGSDEFEAKMSLVPLAIGTLKAAIFAMMFATPLAVMSAVYTAYFMSPSLRGKVKPTIEVMAALPTVILGFLAGLWLAPFIESYLSAVFAILLLLPVLMLITAWCWRYVPETIRNRVGTGREVLILIPVIVAFIYVAVSASPWFDTLFFDGSLRQWLTDNGYNYDQRNALVVGIAMGFAVIPNIFSIAEDAIFNVPRHLTQGSLALGATTWQTMLGVVLPTASPGIFAAVMVGFGRAVGETMIVLMATGNSPLVNFNIFEGMRTLSANIAVELPETAVDSTHFRVLFLAALVLFVFTFAFNTVAEVIRQRLRQRFSNL